MTLVQRQAVAELIRWYNHPVLPDVVTKLHANQQGVLTISQITMIRDLGSMTLPITFLPRRTYQQNNRSFRYYLWKDLRQSYCQRLLALNVRKYNTYWKATIQATLRRAPRVIKDTSPFLCKNVPFCGIIRDVPKNPLSNPRHCLWRYGWWKR
jgi:hypothetical protein